MAHDAQAAALSPLAQVAGDFAADKQAFPVPWGKAMMWIFLLSDTFIFTCFLTSYMNVRMSTTDPWPFPSEVFALHLFGQDIPLILIAIMTFVLITSSGTMALAVNYGYRRNKRRTVQLLIATAVLGATFVGMQAFEWTKLIMEGVQVPAGEVYDSTEAANGELGWYLRSVHKWGATTGYTAGRIRSIRATPT